jgi:hypothetical protein
MVPGLDLSLWENFAHLRLGTERSSVPARHGSPNDTGPPDYIGVGTTDAGCNWWFDLLLEHEAISAPPERCLDFFATFCTRAMTDDDVAAYHAHFEGAPDTIVGEWTPGYMYESWTPMLLQRAAPDAKLIVMLVNPVSRYAATLVRSRRRRRKETDSLSNAVSVGRYASQLRGLLEYYDRDRILVLQLEQCLAEPVEQYTRTLRFLDVADEFTPAGLGRRQIRSARRRFERADVELWPDLAIPMLKELEADVRELRELVPELDLSLWPEFGGVMTHG